MTDISDYESGHEMTIEGMKEKLKLYCYSVSCDNCIFGDADCECKFELMADSNIVKCYKRINKLCDNSPNLAADEKEEINHPERYSGKYECIEVMRDCFGDDAVKAFCRLNAFKYLWRAEKKNGVEDIRKALWYLDYFVGMEDGKDDNRNK